MCTTSRRQPKNNLTWASLIKAPKLYGYLAVASSSPYDWPVTNPKILFCWIISVVHAPDPQCLSLQYPCHWISARKDRQWIFIWHLSHGFQWETRHSSQASSWISSAMWSYSSPLWNLLIHSTHFWNFLKAVSSSFPTNNSTLPACNATKVLSNIRVTVAFIVIYSACHRVLLS